MSFKQMIQDLFFINISFFPVRCVKDRPTAFAYELHKSMKGAGTDDDPLIRVVVARAEVDMVQIKYAFQRDYEESLAEFIAVSKYSHKGRFMCVCKTSWQPKLMNNVMMVSCSL